MIGYQAKKCMSWLRVQLSCPELKMLGLKSQFLSFFPSNNYSDSGAAEHSGSFGQISTVLPSVFSLALKLQCPLAASPSKKSFTLFLRSLTHV